MQSAILHAESRKKRMKKKIIKKCRFCEVEVTRLVGGAVTCGSPECKEKQKAHYLRQRARSSMRYQKVLRAFLIECAEKLYGKDWKIKFKEFKLKQ